MGRPWTIVGGASVSWLGAGCGTALLSVEEGRLCLRVLVLGFYTFTPEQVTRLEVRGRVPFFTQAIRIEHDVPDYPRRILFVPFGPARRALRRIAETGFEPAGRRDETRAGAPIHGALLPVLAMLTALLDLVDDRFFGAVPFGPTKWLVLALVFAASLAIRLHPEVGAPILRPGRSAGELRPWLNLLLLVSPMLLTATLVEWWVG